MKEQTRATLLRSVVPTLLIVLFSLAIDFSRTISNPVEAIITSLLGFYLLTVLMGIISQALPWRLGIRATVLFILSFAVMTLCTGIELQIFSTTDTAEITLYYINGLWQLGIYAFSIAYLFRPDHEDSFGVAIRLHWKRRFWYSWAWRVPLAMTVYIFLYFVVGAIAYGYTGPYYSDPSYGLNLTVPPMDLILLVQVVRSMIYILALIGLIVGFTGSRMKSALLAGLALFMLGGFTPLLSNNEWPAALRVYHTIEILFQNLPAGMLMAYILNPSKTKDPLHA